MSGYYFALRNCLLIAAMTLAGCRQEHLPTYPRQDEAATLHLLAERSNQVKTVSGSGTLELFSPSGDGVQLDLAIALQPPDRARLRAWKFGSAVFDLTITPDGLWFESPRSSGVSPQADKIKSAGMNAAQVARAWGLLSGAFFNDPDLTAKASAAKLIVHRERPNEPAVVCEVNRDTLMPRQYQMLDGTGKAHLTLSLDKYNQIKGIPWPMRITAVSDAGRMVVDLNEVELNADLAAGAFKPPPRAEKLP